VITDYRLRWSDGLKTLWSIRSQYPNYPVIMFTDSGTQEIAVEAMKLGLDDYLVKAPKHFVRLPVAVRSALNRKRAEQRSKLLSDTGTLLISSLDRRTILTQVMQLIVPEFADWCFADVIDSDLAAFDTPIVVASNPLQANRVLELRHRFPPPADANFGAPRVLRTGKPEWAAEIPGDFIEAIAQNEEHHRLLKQLQATSYMTVPLMTQERKLGTITFALSRSGYRYTEEDLAMAMDLAHRVALAIDNVRLYQEARHANRAKDEFLAVVSHELRTPLNSILGWAEMLIDRRLDEATTTKALEVIQRNARLQNKLIDDILDISRIIQNKIHLEMHPVHLVPIIHTTIETVRSQAEAKQITLDLRLDPTVGQVEGDAERLQQIVWNLLSNAIKFTPAGGQVTIELQQIQSVAQITIQDTGQGIHAEFLPYVFDRFRQGNEVTTRAQHGLGLGLAIVRHLVEMHGGSIYATSQGEGQGATFIVQLPARDVAVPILPEETSPTLQDFPDLSPLKVLLCDDDVDSLELLAFVLEQCQAHVMKAESAAKAFRLIQESRPDVLISDIGMPEENGYMLMRKVRDFTAKKGWNLPAIALTAFAREEEKEQALAAGFQLHLPKPIDPSDLIAALLSLRSTVPIMHS